ncbi:MAG: terminase [Oscillospiraceae bacterium]|nr:terminase [Oscillospiraceae bacterium]
MSSELRERTESTQIPAVVEEYLQLVESDAPRACPEQHALAAYIRKVFQTEQLIVEEKRLEKYLSLEKYFPFQLYPWEKFLVALWLCTYKAPGLPRWKTLFCMVGRGAGKDGFIAYVSFCMVSPYNPVKAYDVDICANDEEQAMRPVKDAVEVLENPRLMDKLKRFYYHTKELIQGRENRGVVKGRTNNPKHRDGMRSGMIVFNEIHAYQNYDNIKVFRTGMGKKAEPREGGFTSNGDVSDGPLDDYLERGRRILFQGEEDKGFLPFICCLPNEEAVHDPENWTMANPSLQYSSTLRQEIEDEYLEWKERPEENGDFLNKRMGLRKGFKEIAVTDYGKIKATNAPLPDLTGWSCTIGIDFAELSDFASVNAHFRRGAERYDINRTWICERSKTLHRVKAPYRDWANMRVGGTLLAGAPIVTIVDDVSIHPRLLAEWIQEIGRVCNIKKIAMDNFRWTVVSDALRAIGFDAADKTRVKLIRPSDIMKTDPVVQECFDRGGFTWGNNPCLRWAVNNTKRVRRGRSEGTDTGNYYYAKIDAKARKTDPFMALVASMAVEDALGTGEPLELPKLGAITL